MRIIIDCDGVLSDFTSKAVEIANDLFNKNIKLDNGEWDVFKNDLNISEIDKVYEYISNTQGICRGLKKFDYADELIYKLRNCGEVIACTSVFYGPYFAGERIEWLMQEMGFSHKDIIIAYKKYLVTGDVFIDDKPGNVIEWARTFKKGKACLWQSPNRPIVQSTLEELKTYLILFQPALLMN